MSTQTFTLTLWPSIKDIDTPHPWSGSWLDLCLLLGQHNRIQAKTYAAGFGPYRLTAPTYACTKHVDDQPRTWPHRCDECVAEITLAVFDVDRCTAADVLTCDELLGAAGLARHWYSTFSHTVEQPALRLVLPLGEPVAPSVWPSFRLAVLERYRIPADPTKCGGRSHFYYAPSCPPDAVPQVSTHNGAALPVRQFVAQPKPLVVVPPPPVAWSDPEPIHTLDELREQLRVAGKRMPTAKAKLVHRCLAGVQLAEPGSRNQSTLVLTGVLAYALPSASLAQLCALIEPSLDAMVDDGSKLTWPTVERMLLTAMRKRQETEAQNADIRQALSAAVERAKGMRT